MIPGQLLTSDDLITSDISSVQLDFRQITKKRLACCDAVVSLMSDVSINDLLRAPAFSNDLVVLSHTVCVPLYVHVRSLSAISPELGKAISSGFPVLHQCLVIF